jgi:hypothetical protein
MNLSGWNIYSPVEIIGGLIFCIYQEIVMEENANFLTFSWEALWLKFRGYIGFVNISYIL